MHLPIGRCMGFLVGRRGWGFVCVHGVNSPVLDQAGMSAESPTARLPLKPPEHFLAICALPQPPCHKSFTMFILGLICEGWWSNKMRFKKTSSTLSGPTASVFGGEKQEGKGDRQQACASLRCPGHDQRTGWCSEFFLWHMFTTGRWHSIYRYFQSTDPSRKYSVNQASFQYTQLCDTVSLMVLPFFSPFLFLTASHVGS